MSKDKHTKDKEERMDYVTKNILVEEQVSCKADDRTAAIAEKFAAILKEKSEGKEDAKG